MIMMNPGLGVNNNNDDDKSKVKINIFDIEEIHPNCTVQILKNSVTGEESVGWWDNENPPLYI